MEWNVMMAAEPCLWLSDGCLGGKSAPPRHHIRYSLALVCTVGGGVAMPSIFVLKNQQIIAQNWSHVASRCTASSELPSQSGVQVLLVDLAVLLVPVMMSQQGHVPGSDGTHLHGAGSPLQCIEVVQPVVQDERWGLAMRRAVWGISQPTSLRHGIPRDEDVLQLLLRQGLLGEHLPDFGLAGGGSLITLWDVHRVNRAQAGDDAALRVCGEDLRHGELGGWLCAPEVGRVYRAVDQGGHGLVVMARVVRWDGRGEAWEHDVRISLVQRGCYNHYVIQRVCRARFTDVINLVETVCFA